MGKCGGVGGRERERGEELWGKVSGDFQMSVKKKRMGKRGVGRG